MYLLREHDGNSGVNLIIFCTNSIPLEFVIRNSRPSEFAEIFATIPRSPIAN